MNLDEQSGIGVHLNVAAPRSKPCGSRISSWTRQAASMRRVSWADGGPYRASLSFPATTSGHPAPRSCSRSLAGVSQKMPAPPLDGLVGALDLYAKSMVQMALDLRRQAEIARTLEAQGELAGAAAKYRSLAPVLAGNTAPFEPVAARVREARGALAAAQGSGRSIAAAMRSASTTLNNNGNSFALVGAGEALARAGDCWAPARPRRRRKFCGTCPENHFRRDEDASSWRSFESAPPRSAALRGALLCGAILASRACMPARPGTASAGMARAADAARSHLYLGEYGAALVGEAGAPPAGNSNPMQRIRQRRSSCFPCAARFTFTWDSRGKRRRFSKKARRWYRRYWPERKAIGPISRAQASRRRSSSRAWRSPSCSRGMPPGRRRRSRMPGPRRGTPD